MQKVYKCLELCLSMLIHVLMLMHFRSLMLIVWIVYQRQKLDGEDKKEMAGEVREG